MFGHTEHLHDVDWVKHCVMMEVDGTRHRGQVRKTRREDQKTFDSSQDDAQVRKKMEEKCKGHNWLYPVYLENNHAFIYRHGGTIGRTLDLRFPVAGSSLGWAVCTIA